MTTGTLKADVGHRTATRTIRTPEIRDLPTGLWEFCAIEARTPRAEIENVMDDQTRAAQIVCRAAQVGADTPGRGWIVDMVTDDHDPVADMLILRFTFRRRPGRIARIRRWLAW